MKKLVTLIITVAFLNATESRLAGMNVRSIQTDDITNVLLVSPVYLLDYKNSIVGEHGNAAPPNVADYAGLLLSFGEASAVGAYVGRRPNINLHRTAELVYASDLEAIKLGVNLAFSNASSSSTGISGTTSYFSITPAIQLKNIPLDLVINYAATSLEGKDSGTNIGTKTSSSIFSILGRLRVYDSNFLYARILSLSGKVEDIATKFSVSNNAMEIAAGYAINHKYDKGLIIAGAEFHVVNDSGTIAPGVAGSLSSL
ncbi:MAG: hypothetical protein NZ870_05145, partial [bacterium]|nr:hypothetical protein [bacterium]